MKSFLQNIRTFLRIQKGIPTSVKVALFQRWFGDESALVALCLMGRARTPPPQMLPGAAVYRAFGRIYSFPQLGRLRHVTVRWCAWGKQSVVTQPLNLALITRPGALPYFPEAQWSQIIKRRHLHCSLRLLRWNWWCNPMILLSDGTTCLAFLFLVETNQRMTCTSSLSGSVSTDALNIHVSIWSSDAESDLPNWHKKKILAPLIMTSMKSQASCLVRQ
jgi:hypothetical protein